MNTKERAVWEVGVIEVNDKRYPSALKTALANLVASSGPKRIYYKGTWDEALFKNCLAVVGSRRLTQYGKMVTRQLVSEIAPANVTIVSGFMYGGDKAAHESACAVGGKTIAVMPCGIDLVHPAGQEDLYEDILQKGGLIISEYEGKVQPQNFTYVQRDRIVAGLSQALLVTEAAIKSGSLLTAGYAKRFGRKVFAVPGPITSEVSKGTVKLIREGAEAVLEAKNILEFFNIAHEGSGGVFLGDLQEPRAKLAGKCPAIAGNSLESKIIDHLKNESMNVDDMARALAVPVAHLGTTLSLMQLKGFISQADGKYYLS